VAVFLGSAILSVICGILYYDVHLRGSILATIAQILGTISSILMIFQWAPQIYTTWKKKSAGALSLLMLLLQMPGALLVMFFQAVLNAADITTWAPYAFLFVEQLILVILISIYRMRERTLGGSEKEARRLLDDEVDSVSVRRISNTQEFSRPDTDAE